MLLLDYFPSERILNNLIMLVCWLCFSVDVDCGGSANPRVRTD